VSVQVSTLEDLEHGVVAGSVFASGLVAMRPPIGADPVLLRLTGPFGPAGAETGLGIELDDTDGGAVRSVTIDWGDGIVRTWEPPCDMQLVEPQGSRWHVRPPHGYDEAGELTVHISVTTGTACGVSAPDQTVTGEATATVLPRSGG
ncbi:MAG: hypothetical protein JWO68_3043, partial [Actinomycetia bacterium]|nr:hypothetical protein [Actinomycetes bacterium]